MLSNWFERNPRPRIAEDPARSPRRSLAAARGRIGLGMLVGVGMVLVVGAGQAPGQRQAPGKRQAVEAAKKKGRHPETRHRVGTSSPLDFYEPLKHWIEYLKDQADYDKSTGKYHEWHAPEGRKAMLLDKALGTYHKLVGQESSMKAVPLAKADEFDISPTKNPPYFSTKDGVDPALRPEARRSDGLYEYKPKKEDTESRQLWVDFANMKLGGGVFGNGFVQEEVMFLETPELANTAGFKQPFFTRTGTSAGVLEGSPRPWLFEDAHRVMKLDLSKLEPDPKEHWRTIDYKKLDAANEPLDQAQRINVLSMAAPELPEKGKKATLPIVKDLFNTFAAGFSLARSQYPNQTILIHTGPMGAGVFHNDRSVVYVLQRLAALHASKGKDLVNLRFWAYSTKDKDDAEAYYKAILVEFGKQQDHSVHALLVIAAKQMEAIEVK